MNVYNKNKIIMQETLNQQYKDLDDDIDILME